MKKLNIFYDDGSNTPGSHLGKSVIKTSNIDEVKSLLLNSEDIYQISINVHLAMEFLIWMQGKLAHNIYFIPPRITIHGVSTAECRKCVGSILNDLVKECRYRRTSRDSIIHSSPTAIAFNKSIHELEIINVKNTRTKFIINPLTGRCSLKMNITLSPMKELYVISIIHDVLLDVFEPVTYRGEFSFKRNCIYLTLAHKKSGKKPTLVKQYFKQC